MELISVIVPVYQAEKYIGRCIKSIIDQTYKELEIIIINDGSLDSSGAIIKEYATIDPRILVITQENKGLSGARNAGLERAHGSWITFVDADDYLVPNAIELMYRAVSETGTLMAVGNCEMTYEETVESYVTHASASGVISFAPHIVSSDDIVKQLIRTADLKYVTAWGKLYRADLFANIRFPEGKLFEDTYINYLLYDTAGEITVFDEKIYGYYMSPNSIMRSAYSVDKLRVIDSYEQRYKYYERLGKYELRDLALEEYYFKLLKARALGRKFFPDDALVKDILGRIESVYRTVRNEKAFSSHKSRIKAFIGRYFEGVYTWRWGDTEYQLL